MLCPNCKAQLHPVAASAHYGSQMIVDQCANCGGIWSDPGGFYQIKPSEAERIDKLDFEKLREPASIGKELFCPADNTPLKPLRDPNFPKSIIIETCSRCGGFWFNRGELAEFHKARIKPSKKSKLDPKLEEQIDKLLKLHSNTDTMEMLGDIGGALSAPVNRHTMRTMDESGQSGWGGTAANIVFTLLRLLIRR